MTDAGVPRCGRTESILEFLLTSEPDFRQIVRFVLYAYEPHKDFLCRIAALENDAVPYSP